MMALTLHSTRSVRPCANTNCTLPTARTVPCVARPRDQPPSVRSAGVPATSAARPVVRALAAGPGATATAAPTPIVKIDNISDPFATVVSVEFGEKAGDLLDTITALKNLGLNIRRAKLLQKAGAASENVFYITDADTSEKIVRSARLEDIRMTIINSLVSQFPEAGEAMGFGGAAKSIDEPNKALGTVRKVVQTTIDVLEASNGSCSVLKITTRDRPGLLVDIVRVLKDINLNVVSAEIDTVGSLAKDEFFITYRGEPLNSPMELLVTNALQYYLSLAEVAKEESY